MISSQPYKSTDMELLHYDSQATSITPREIEILSLISKGYSTGEIADNLYISFETVKTHRSRLMQKMQVNNAAFLVRKAFEYQLIH